MSRRRASLAEVLTRVADEFEPPPDAGTEVPLWVPFPPQPNRGIALPDGRVLSPQQLALETPADELFFGGAPGGGKSQLLLGAAVTQHRNSIVFRREFSQLRGAEGIWQQSHDLIGIRGTPNESTFTWRDLPGQRVLEFGATGHLAQHWLKYKGRPHDLKGFDELPEIPEDAYRFLIGWLRTRHEHQRVRVIGTGNPPITPESQWVLRYWAPWLDKHHPRPAQLGELRWFVSSRDGDREVEGPAWGWERPPAVLVDGRLRLPRSRTFVLSRYEDNPLYVRTGYGAVLDNLPEPLRSLLRDGDFAASIPDDPWQVIPTAWVEAAMARWTPDAPQAQQPVTLAGNDPSRGGQDEFAIANRHGTWVAPLRVFPAAAAPDGIQGAQLVAVSVPHGTRTQIDIGGAAGSSVYDQCRALKMDVVALNGSERTDEKDRSGKLGFFNKRAKWFWRVREALDPASDMGLALPPDPQMKADLCSTRWELTVRGIKCEDKERVKQRLGRSPDRGEAVVYCIAEEREAKASVRVGVWGGAR